MTELEKYYAFLEESMSFSDNPSSCSTHTGEILNMFDTVLTSSTRKIITMGTGIKPTSLPCNLGKTNSTAVLNPTFHKFSQNKSKSNLSSTVDNAILSVYNILQKVWSQ